MRKGIRVPRIGRKVAVAAVVATVATCTAMVLPGTALADNSAGTAACYATKDSTMAKPVVNTGNDESSLLKKAMALAKSNYKVVIRLNRDWNTRSYGHIVVPEGANVEFYLNGHMLDRDLADSTYYGVGDGDVFSVRKNATLSIDGGGNSEFHKGKLCNGGKFWEGKLCNGGKFWESTSDGNYLISGGLVCGGASHSNQSGGGITVVGEGAKVYLKNVTLAGNVADNMVYVHGLGGGIYMHGTNQRLELDNAKILYNRAETGGGGIYVDGKNTAIVAKNSSISSNSGAMYGGGIEHTGEGGAVTLVNSAINNNDTEGGGGGIYDYEDGTTFSLENSSISDNYASGTYEWMNGSDKGRGAGILLSNSATVTMTKGSKISGNKGYDGAGVHMKDEDILLTMDGGSMIQNNVASRQGGGVYVGDDCQTIVMRGGSKICGNSAGESGGGINGHYGSSIFLDENIRIQMEEGSSICDNSAPQGGGVNDEFMGTMHISSEDCTGSISGNKADNGGGVFTKVKTVFTNISITGNSATKRFGGLRCAEGCTSYLKGKMIITGNYASQKKSDYSCGSLCLHVDDSRLLTADSRIGLDMRGTWPSESVTSWDFLESRALLDKVGSQYANMFFCDDKGFKISRVDDITLAVNKGIPDYYICAIGSSNTLDYITASSDGNVVLDNSQYAQSGYVIDYWDIMSQGSTTKVYSENGTATVQASDNQVYARAHYASVLTGLELNLKSSASWDELGQGASAELGSLRLTGTGDTSYGITATDAVRSAATVTGFSAQANDDGSKTVSCTVWLAAPDRHGGHLLRHHRHGRRPQRRYGDGLQCSG